MSVNVDANEQLEQQATDAEEHLENRHGGYLPPIHRIKLPKTATQSALIRWLFEMGYTVKDISHGLNTRYQQVRNIVTTLPKRAAREDMPPLTLELVDMEDVVDALLGGELERTFHEEARQRKAAEKRARRNRDIDDIDNAEG